MPIFCNLIYIYIYIYIVYTHTHVCVCVCARILYSTLNWDKIIIRFHDHNY